MLVHSGVNTHIFLIYFLIYACFCLSSERCFPFLVQALVLILLCPFAQVLLLMCIF